MTELQTAEKQLFELTQKVAKLRKDAKATPVKNYIFKTLDGDVSLLNLFGDKDILFLIHNMGQGCRYCTLWADGLNSFLPHLESQFGLALVSKDPPQIQRTFANSRNWRYKMASHGGGDYVREQTVMPGESNMPGMVCYIKQGSEILRKNSVIFGPGDEFCSIWNVLSLAGIGEEQWHPQYNYWKHPEKLDDGGQKLI